MSIKNFFPNKQILYFAGWFITGLSFFELFRLLFLIGHHVAARGIPTGTLVTSFVVGARFDINILCILLSPFCLIALILQLMFPAGRRWKVLLSRLLTGIFAASFLIFFVDFEFFDTFHGRLNAYVTEYTDSLRVSLGMVWQSYPVVRYLIFFGVLAILAFRLVRRFERRFLLTDDTRRPFNRLAYLLPAAFLLFLGIRGRVEEKSTLNWGLAFFSNYAFANQLALNPVYTLGMDYFTDHNDRVRSGGKIHFFTDSAALNNVKSVLGVPAGSTPPLARTAASSVTAPEARKPRNVVIIAIESFGASYVGALGGNPDLTPNFNRLSRNGFLFTDIYSGGFHTFMAVFSIACSMPNLTYGSILKDAMGQQEFSGIGSLLRRRGYATYFFVPHDPAFDNMYGFMRQNGFDRIVGLDDYDNSPKLSTLGVADHTMFEKAVDLLSQQNEKPFLAMLLTSTNHVPYIVPDVDFGRLPGESREVRKLNTFKYSDWALGRFFSLAERKPWFKNTVFVVTADHGFPHNPRYDFDLSLVHVPLWIWMPGVEGFPSKRIDRTGSHIDIMPTVMGLCGFSYVNNTFGKDLLDTAAVPAPFAFFLEEETTCLIKDRYFLVDRLNAGRHLYDLRAPGSVDLVTVEPERVAAMTGLSHSILQSSYYLYRNRLCGLPEITAANRK
jgi:phosphoglycerol transferase MdoB-like AlkP superfamily enzyme